MFILHANILLRNHKKGLNFSAKGERGMLGD